MTPSKERNQILEMIENSTISAEEGLLLLQALESSQDEASPSGGDDVEALEGGVFEGSGRPAPTSKDLLKWKRWWILPLLIGLGIILLSGGLMYSAWNVHGFGLLFLLTWVPFGIGVAITAFAWGSRHSPWLHLRIQQKPGEKPQRIAFSFPIPIRMTAWGLRKFGHRIPQMDATGLDEVLIALKDAANEDTPLIIDVDEGEDGEKVQVIIG